jgi:hypothetical protein
MGAHGEYLNDRWSLRAEVSHESDPKLQSATGGYGELALRVTENWQIAGLWSTLRTDLLGANQTTLDANVARAPGLLKHDELGAGLNYWFTPNFVLKTSMHWVEGNRFASPDPARVRSLVASGKMLDRTTVVLVGSQLSF